MVFETTVPVPPYDRYTAHLIVVAHIKHLNVQCRWGLSGRDNLVTMRASEPVDTWKPVEIPARGRKVRFQLDASVRKWIRPTQNREFRLRVPNIDYMANMDWLDRQATQVGLKILSSDFDPIKVSINRQPRPFIMDASRFRGQATIEDPALFERGLATGIGNAKAYGFGFLLYSVEG